MNAERLLYSRLGIVPEDPQINPLAAALLIGLSKIYAGRSGLQVIGSINATGPGLIIGNHIEAADTLRAIYMGVHNVTDEAGQPTIGRLIRGVAKSTLFGIPESAEVRKRTGKTDILNSDHPLVNAIIRMTVGSVLDGVGAIPIRRGAVDRHALGLINDALSKQQLVAFSIMESRIKTGQLRGIGQGAAFIIRKNPDVPFYLVGASKNPNVVQIAKPLTYTELRNERGDLSTTELTLALADGIAALLPPDIQEAWLKERIPEANRLFRH